MPVDLTTKDVQLTKRTLVGVGCFHLFENNQTNEIVPVEITQGEYDLLCNTPGDSLFPTLTGHTWKYTVGGALKVDSPTGYLGKNEYVVVDDKAYLSIKTKLTQGKMVLATDVVNNSVSVLETELVEIIL